MENSKPIFICDHNGCEKIFTTKYSMQRHVTTHLKKKNFKCKECEKTFSIKQNLIEHEFVHTGELPYVWNFNGCSERFRQRGKLSLHRQTHKNYKKKSYRSHISINEGEMKQRESTELSGESINMRSNTTLLAQTCLPQSMVTPQNNFLVLNASCQKLNQLTYANIVGLNQNVSNRSYQVMQTSLHPFNMFGGIGRSSQTSGAVLPKLSVVMMPNNQLGCKLN